MHGATQGSHRAGSEEAGVNIADPVPDPSHPKLTSIRPLPKESQLFEFCRRLSGGPVVLDGGRSLPVLTVSWLNALQDLTELVSNL